MKKHFMCIILNLGVFSFAARAQGNVGINQTAATPDASAMLDVNAPDKGLLVPRVNLASLSDATTIPNAAVSLLIYNINGALAGGTGYYYNAGTNAVPAWVKLQVAGQSLSQSSTSYFSTGALTVPVTAALAYLPGFPVTITVPANCSVLMNADVGAETTSVSSTGFSIVDIGALVDGVVPANGAYQRVHIANTAGLVNQFHYTSFSQALVLGAGTHTIGLVAGGPGGTGSNTVVGGDTNSVLQATLTITIVKN